MQAGVECNLSNEVQDVSNQTTKTHATPSCVLPAIEWWLYSGGRKIQQQQSAKTTGRGSLKDAGGCD